MNDYEMLDFLVTHDIDLVSNDTHRIMSADCLFKLSGEFTVYEKGASHPIYRGDDFEIAMLYLEGKE